MRTYGVRVLVVADVVRYGWCLAEPATWLRLFFVNEHDHPYAHCTGLTEQGCAVYPSWSALFVRVLEVGNGVWKPADLCCDAARSVGECVAEGVSNPVAATDAVEETGLENSRDTERW
jgi:hypothetical protein